MPDGKTWMAENLNYKMEDSYCNPKNNCGDSYGRLYAWNAALKACPSGWRLPTKTDIEKMLTVVGRNKQERGLHLRTNHDWKTSGDDAYLFSAFPAGLYSSGDRKFDLLGSAAVFWSSTGYDSGNAYSLGISDDNAYLGRGSKNLASSVRCIQDSIPVPEKTPEKKAKQSAPKKSEKVEAASAPQSAAAKDGEEGGVGDSESLAPQKTKKKVAKKVTEDVDNSDKHIPSNIEGAGDNAGGNESKIRWVPIGISAVAIVGGAVVAYIGESKAKDAYEGYDNGKNSFRKSTDDAHNGQTLRTAGIITAIVGALGLGISIAF